MFKLRELYQELIIDHGRHPRNRGVLPHAHFYKEGFNPLCGDQLTLYINAENGVIENIVFEGTGCAISMASASLMTETLKGKTLSECDALFTAFHALVTEGTPSDLIQEKMPKLAALAGVSEFPARVKCATLAWHTFKAAFSENTAIVCTEESE